jgi:dinuclear metal center YbgI/SA1388 family protein
MADRKKLVAWLDKFLDVNYIKDYGKNGLQVPGKDEVKKVSLAVDPSLEVIEKAISKNSDMLITHHLLLDSSGRLLEIDRRRLKPALAADLNIYCCHLPLDKHSVVGNNVNLAKLLGLEVKGEFGIYNDKPIGCWAKFNKPKSFSEFEAIVRDKLKVDVIAKKFGLDSVEKVGIVSGGGGYHVKEASTLGLDTILTGNFSHHAIIDARDIKINIIMAGHYGSEKLGVQEVGKKIKDKFTDVETEFIEDPTGF